MSIAVCSDVICKKSRIELCDRMEQCGGAAVFHVCFIIIYSNFAHQKLLSGHILIIMSAITMIFCSRQTNLFCRQRTKIIAAER